MAPSLPSSISRTIGPPPPHLPPSHSEVMLRSTDGHQSRSSQDVHHQHRPNPAHSQAMFGPTQLMAARNAPRVEYPPSIYIPCDTGMFSGRTIRAEVNEVQKANVGRKYVFRCRATRLEPLPFFETEYLPTFFVDMQHPKIDVPSTRRQSQSSGYSTFELPRMAHPKRQRSITGR